MLLVLHVLSSWIGGGAVPVWTPVMIIIGSSQLLVLGLLAEYLGRLYLEGKISRFSSLRTIVRGALAPVGTLATPPIATREHICGLNANHSFSVTISCALDNTLSWMLVFRPG
jgi:hypothetical protein